MIRVLQKADIERVVDIWLDTNLKAHYFIPGQYWKDNIDLVKEMLPQAEVYVYENDCQIEGFIGLNDEYMEGIFVRDEMQSQGIGKLLLNFVKEKRTKLYLNVYQKNTRAIHFYQREGFEIQREGLDDDLMYDSLMKLKPLENPKKNPMQNALRKYYYYRNGKEFPRLNNYQR